jgi:hypothetical protein
MLLELTTDEEIADQHPRANRLDLNQRALVTAQSTIVHLRATTDTPTVDELPSTSTSQLASSRL